MSHRFRYEIACSGGGAAAFERWKVMSAVAQASDFGGSFFASLGQGVPRYFGHQKPHPAFGSAGAALVAATPLRQPRQHHAARGAEGDLLDLLFQASARARSGAPCPARRHCNGCKLPSPVAIASGAGIATADTAAAGRSPQGARRKATRTGGKRRPCLASNVSNRLRAAKVLSRPKLVRHSQRSQRSRAMRCRLHSGWWALMRLCSSSSSVWARQRPCTRIVFSQSIATP